MQIFFNYLTFPLYRTFEFDAVLPMDSTLKLEVWDYDALRDEIIGETFIDLEDRWVGEWVVRGWCVMCGGVWWCMVARVCGW